MLGVTQLAHKNILGSIWLRAKQSYCRLRIREDYLEVEEVVGGPTLSLEDGTSG